MGSLVASVAGEGPLYQNLYGSLRTAILDGRLAAGTRLPSTRELAQELGVSRNTIITAFDHLVAEGFIAGRRGSGSYVANDVGPRFADHKTGRAHAASALPHLSAYGRGVGDPPTPSGAHLRYDFVSLLFPGDLFPHGIWRRLLHRVSPQVSGATHFSAPEGNADLRVAIASYLQRYRAVTADPSQILITNGVQQGLDLVTRLFIDRGDRVVMEEPHYPNARELFIAAGAHVTPVPVDAEGMRTDALPRGRTRLAYVTPSHQVPTGAVMSLRRRRSLLDWAERSDAFIAEDDFGSEYRYVGRPVEAIQSLDAVGRVIYLGSFSGVMFKSLRLGYLVAPTALVRSLSSAKWLADRYSPLLEQAVLAEFMGAGHFERHLRRLRTLNIARRNCLLAALDTTFGDRVAIEGAPGGLTLLVWFKDLRAERLPTLIARAAAAGVALNPVTTSYLKPPPLAGVVFGYATLSEPEIVAGVKQLHAVVAGREVA